VNTDLIAYYKDRAAEYEKIYTKPERQPDLQQATQISQQHFRDKAVLEIACGTGYWTERIAKTATSIVATDINAAVIEIAKSKTYTPDNVSFKIADIFQLHNFKQYEGLFGGFIWSHIPVQELDHFLEVTSKYVIPGGTIVFMDNNYIAGSNLLISNTDVHGNTFQNRQLENGATYSVLKNFPTRAFIEERLRRQAIEINIISLTYFWIAVCKNR